MRRSVRLLRDAGISVLVAGVLLVIVEGISRILSPSSGDALRIVQGDDAVSQTLMAVPMYALYEGGVLMCRILIRDKPPDPESDPA